MEDEEEDIALAKEEAANINATSTSVLQAGLPPSATPLAELYDEASCERVLPTFLPPMGSLQEQMDTILWEVDLEVRGEFLPEQGGLLNPLAPILAPLQLLLHNINVQVRLASRAISWEDRILTFQLLRC